MPWEKEVLWIYFFGYLWKIFILPFLNTPGYTLLKKYNVLPRHFRLELLPFLRGVWHICKVPSYHNRWARFFWEGESKFSKKLVSLWKSAQTGPKSRIYFAYFGVFFIKIRTALMKWLRFLFWEKPLMQLIPLPCTKE